MAYLSYRIKRGNQHILFDTGQTDLFLQNAKSIGLDCFSVNTIVLSHGHYLLGKYRRYLEGRCHS
jgi:7,8-dihydropterin-6-yl-methyl-4-(beta-D-ribofuranosyl)aminobenzene 5'-phosphate synthase